MTPAFGALAQRFGKCCICKRFLSIVVYIQQVMYLRRSTPLYTDTHESNALALISAEHAFTTARFETRNIKPTTEISGCCTNRQAL